MKNPKYLSYKLREDCVNIIMGRREVVKFSRLNTPFGCGKF